MDLFNEIKSVLDIKEVANFYGTELNSKGSALCPFHKENTPSFKIFTGSNSFYCFGCGVGGSVIDFTMKSFNLTNLEAARKLDADFNLGLSGKAPSTFSLKSIAKTKEDKALIEEFRQWEKQAFRTLANYFKALRFWGEMFYLRKFEYFSRYERDIENIVMVETMLDIMMENTDNFEKQVSFYNNYGKLVQDIENRRQNIEHGRKS
jgi:DNA primase